MSSSRSSHAMVRWVVEQVTGRDIGRKPPKRSNVMQRGPARSWRYRGWIRSLPCSICDIEGPSVQAAHTGDDGGAKQKSSDYSCIPLCASHHTLGNDSYHRLGRDAFEGRHGIDCQVLARRLASTWFKYSNEVK